MFNSEGHTNKNPGGGSSIRDTLASFAESIAYPNKDANQQDDHDAAHGSRLVNSDPPETLYDELHGEKGLRNIKVQGNQGQGHDSGLKRKGVEHQEQLAERSRLARAGEFEPHKKHADMVAAHPDTAHASDTPPPAGEVGGIGAQVEDQRLV
ncbi:hypothetical protein JCM8097_000673 [Rhodosporidiobolus ruineniae]